MQTRRLAGLVALTALLGAFAAGLAPGALGDHRDPSCPADLPIRDHFDSGGILGFSFGSLGFGFHPADMPLVGDAVHLTGPTTDCREPVTPDAHCLATGEGTAPAIHTRLVQLDLSGTSINGLPVHIHASDDRPSDGMVGPFKVHCTPDGMGHTLLSFDQPAPSFFDVFVEVALPGVPFELHNADPFHVENELCGLPPGPDGVDVCQPQVAYQHGPAGLPLQLPGGLPSGFQLGMGGHNPHFVPDPPAFTGEVVTPLDPDPSVSEPVFQFVLADLAKHPITDVDTLSVHTSNPFVKAFATPWLHTDGHTWHTNVVVVPLLPLLCTQGDSVDITLKVREERGDAHSVESFTANWCEEA
jgi:hypothetical protein